ncbi:MAG TPA: hypothetical protein VI172_04065 [Candidatus Dormibacteraeota bacterium]|jgi:DNA-binding CsgD family transcriptional regulator
MIAEYSRKVWYTVPSAHGMRGVDANAPKEPAYFGPQVRLAARIVDELVGGHPANLGACDCGDCSCDLRVVGSRTGRTRRLPCWHDATCPHTGVTGDEAVSPRLYALVVAHPDLQAAFDNGLESVYAMAGLTAAEAEVARYQHQGVSRSSIARMTGRADGTLNALIARVHRKLRALAVSLEQAA